jgi:hypothetical protein
MVVAESSRARNLPDRDRLSVLIAVILLSFSLTHFVEVPAWEPEIQLPGFYLSIIVSIQNVVLILVSGLTAAGADWLFHDHPALQGRSTIPYWLLPSLTVFGIGLPLMQLPLGLIWWGWLMMGGIVLTFVLVGEYISIDTGDIRQPLAAAVLTAVAFALFLLLAIGFHIAELRLFFLMPGVFIGTWLVSVRSLHLRLHGEWAVYESAIIAFVVTQFSAGIIYWPLPPVTFGILLLGPTYALNSLFIGLIEERPLKNLLVEPAVALAVAIGVALWIS